MKLVAILTLFLTATAYADADDGQEGHGGDAIAYEFTETARGLVEGLERTGLDGLPSPSFVLSLREAIQSTLVHSAVAPTLDGIEVDAINYPNRNPPLIVVNRVRWGQYAGQFRKKRILAAHEFLSILGVDDRRYEISANLVYRLELKEASLRGGKQAELGEAISQCDANQADRLIQGGANVYVRFSGGDTALHLAASAGCPTLVGKFIRYGLSPNALNDKGWTPLFAAVWNYHYSIPNTPRRDLFRLSVRRLIDAGADVNLQTAATIESTLLFPALLRLNQTVLVRAMMGIYDIDVPGMFLPDDPVLVDLLLNTQSIDVNLADENGFTALHQAVALGRIDYVTALLQKGADPNLKSVRSDTPLDLAAASQEHFQLIHALLDAGAKPGSLALSRAITATTNLERDTLALLSRLAASPDVNVNLALGDATRLTYRLATERGINNGAKVMKLLVDAPSFNRLSCLSWMALDELHLLSYTRWADIYKDTHQVLREALKNSQSPTDCGAH